MVIQHEIELDFATFDYKCLSCFKIIMLSLNKQFFMTRTLFSNNVESMTVTVMESISLAGTQWLTVLFGELGSCEN